MIIEYDDNYGVDIDGNRGISIIDNVELETSDADMVKEKIKEEYIDYDLTYENVKELWDDEVYFSIDIDESTFDFNEKPCNWFDNIDEFIEMVIVK